MSFTNVLHLIRLLVELGAPLIDPKEPEFAQAWWLHRWITAYLRKNT